MGSFETPRNIAVDGVAFLLGKRIGALLVPVSICMFLVSWSTLNLSNLFVDQQMTPLFVVMNENAQNTIQGKIGSSLVNAMVLVCVLVVMTFLMVLLYTYHCEKVLFGFMMISAISMFFMMWIWMDLFCTRYQIPYDFLTSAFLIWNIGVVGLISIFYHAPPIIEQMYLVVVSVIVGWLLTFVSEWTSWSILVSVALYDAVAVMSPRGPLRMLIHVAEERNEALPGFVYNSSSENALIHTSPPPPSRRRELAAEEVPVGEDSRRIQGNMNRNKFSKMPPASRVYLSFSCGPFKLGLGDFIFYSLLSGKAARYSFMPWIMSTVALCCGLVMTLISLLLYRDKFPALPALPISICLGVIVFFLYRYVIDPLDWFAALSVLAL